jgi:TonB family protein
VGTRHIGQYTSDVMALTLTAALAAVLLVCSRSALRLHRQPSPDSPSIEISTESTVAPTPQLPPPEAPRRMQPRHAVIPPSVLEVPPEALLPKFEQQSVPQDAALVASAAPVSTSNPHPDVDAQYAAQLRADIDRRTRPPDSARYRLRHPTGEVYVRFVVTRAGLQKSSTLVRSSGSVDLDDTALQIVSSGHYPPMPAEAFAGEAEHAFLVTIEFRSAVQMLGAR